MSLPFEPIRMGSLRLRNRIAMAPMTRNRATGTGAPTPDTALHYAQRADAGLIITEGTQPGPEGHCYPNTPGLHAPEHVAGWTRVADAVHERGGQIVVQLMHVGRIAHPDNKHGAPTVAPSALAAEGTIHTAAGPAPYPVPSALSPSGIAGAVAQFADAARAAREAGIDGVELHAANGYLLHQFLSPATNRRTDAYGGGPQARTRFVAEVAAAVCGAIGADRVGIRISPGADLHGALEEDPQETAATYRVLVDRLSALGPAYLHTIGDPGGPLLRGLLGRFTGRTVVSTGWDPVTDLSTVVRSLAQDHVDVVAVGRPFIANPDLVSRWRHGSPLNTPDPATFYGGDHRGYTDYPRFGGAAALPLDATE